MEKVRKTIKAGRLKIMTRCLNELTERLPPPVSDFDYWIGDDKVTKWEKLDGKPNTG